MKVLIAEKPSVAQSIAAIVGANNRREGYLEGNGFAVTWAFGHLVGLAMPQDCNKQILNRHFSVKLNRHIIVETIGL